MRLRQPRSLSIRRDSPLRPRRRRTASESDEAPEAERPVPPLGPGHLVDAEHVDEVIDLLNPQQAVIIDQERLRRALSFGFAGGDTSEVLTEALHRASVAASDWEAGCFEEGLFLPELLRTCLRVRLEGFEPEVDQIFLTRLLTHPPKDRAVVEFRREILRALSDDRALRVRFQGVYRAIYRLRQLFESEAELDDGQRRLSILTAIRDSIEAMATGFEGARSGLERLDRYGKRAKADLGYQRLCELLDYDNHLAGVELSLRIGADGRIRRFELQRVSENKENRFYQSPMGRWMTRLMLLFRGYMLGEDELINRWVDSVFDGVTALLPPLFQLLGEMEFFLSALAFKETCEAQGLSVCFPELEGGDEATEGGPARSIRGLFNPLLLAQERPPVPCDLEADQWETITIVTGPNSGGKTRLLQALAIAQMLGQCGAFAPARSARLGSASGLFVSLIQEARADQREGRLGTELIRIRQLFERARPGFLIVLDELCSGTNPSEGEEIFRLVISLLRELRPCVLITTHFLQFAARLKAGAAEEGELRFLQVELDDEECPTFHFIDGVAETSLAHQTAARLGVTREELLALVRRHR